MKNFAKNRLMSFLLVAITALCALFGVILTTPNTVKADASTTPATIDYGSLPSEELKEGDNLFGKYILIRETNPSGDSTSAFNISTSGFNFTGDDIKGTDTVTFFDATAIKYFAVDYKFLGTYVVVDFTTKKSFTAEDMNGNASTINYTEEDFTVTRISLSSAKAFILYPLDNGYEIKELEKGDNLAGQWIRIDANSNPLGWDSSGQFCQVIFDGGICLYYDETYLPIICTVENGSESGDVLEIFSSVGQIDPECGDNFPSYLYIKLPETAFISEEIDEFGNTEDFETTFIFQEFIGAGEDAFENPVHFVAIEDDTPTETPDTPNEPTDGEQPKDDIKENFSLLKLFSIVCFVVLIALFLIVFRRKNKKYR